MAIKMTYMVRFTFLIVFVAVVTTGIGLISPPSAMALNGLILMSEDPNDECPKIIPSYLHLTWKPATTGSSPHYYRLYAVHAPNRKEALQIMAQDEGDHSYFTPNSLPELWVFGLADGRWYFSVAGVHRKWGQGSPSEISCGRVLGPPPA